MVEIDYCKWCKYNQHRCEAEHAKRCDFASLPMEQEAVLERAKLEYAEIQKLRDALTKGTLTKEEQEMAALDAGDKAEGLRIMMEVLNVEFGVSRIEIANTLGIKTPNFIEKVKLMKKMKELEHARRKK